MSHEVNVRTCALSRDMTAMTLTFVAPFTTSTVGMFAKHRPHTLNVILVQLLFQFECNIRVYIWQLVGNRNNL